MLLKQLFYMFYIVFISTIHAANASLASLIEMTIIWLRHFCHMTNKQVMLKQSYMRVDVLLRGTEKTVIEKQGNNQVLTSPDRETCMDTRLTDVMASVKN